MTVLSLFDGMSCGQIALERAGLKVDKYFASEIDKHAIKVAMANYPNTIQLGNVKEVNGDKLGWIDLLIGGSPCQGFSFAGDQLAFDDPRSVLFFEYVRILNELRKINPDIKFFLENVKMKKEYEHVISGILGVRPTQLCSSLVSAQMRGRLYWTNIPVNSVPENKRIILNDILETGYYADKDKSYCIDANYGKGTNFKRYFFRGSRQLVFENGYYPGPLTEETANKVMHNDGNRWRKLTRLECERLQTLPDGYTNNIPLSHAYHAIGNGWTVDIVVHILKNISLRE